MRVMSNFTLAGGLLVCAAFAGAMLSHGSWWGGALMAGSGALVAVIGARD